MTSLLGKKHNELLDDLLERWIPGGKRIAVLEGFPGVGKTELADQLIAHTDRKSVYVECPQPHVSAAADLMAHLGERLAEAGFPAVADAGPEQKSQLIALRAVLKEPVLIVIDEFQNTFIGKTGQPEESLAKFLEELSHDQGLGHLLLLTNREVERSRWSEHFDKRPFPELDSLEAEQLLIQLLTNADNLEEVPPSRRPDIVNGLGKNPRALTTLVRCLADESLDELFDAGPQPHEIQDRKVSAQLVERLESEILKRAMRHLDHETLVFLRRLCAHRLSLRKDVLQFMAMPGTDLIRLIADLTQRFMLSRKKEYYHIHPIVVAIARERWAAESEEMVKAHSVAADFYERPFKAKQLVLSGRTGGQFAELRYHLTKAGRADDLAPYRDRVVREIAQCWSDSSPTPRDPSDRDDHILLLSVALLSPGPPKLEIYLVRLLRERRKAGDLELALVHAERAAATRNPNWVYLQIELEAAVKGEDTAIRTSLGYLRTVGPNVHIYMICAELLKKVGLKQDAIVLLEEAIAKLPDVAELYQRLAEFRAEDEPDKAIEVLKDGISKVPDAGSLYHSYAEILANRGRSAHAIEVLQEGIKNVPLDKDLDKLYLAFGHISSWSPPRPTVIPMLLEGIRGVPTSIESDNILVTLLYYAAANGNTTILTNIQKEVATRPVKDQFKLLANVLLLQSHKQWGKAAQIASAGLERFPKFSLLAAQAAISHIRANDLGAAESVLRPFSETNTTIVWLRAMIAELRGDQEKASEFLSALGQPLSGDDGPIRSSLLHFWSSKLSRLSIPNFPTQLDSVANIEVTTPTAVLSETLVPTAHAQDKAQAAAPAELSLEERLKAALSTAYFEQRLNDAEYQAAFQNAGKEKAQNVLEKFRAVPEDKQSRYAYVSIGGADASEVAWALRNSPISRAVMIEYGSQAAAQARERAKELHLEAKTLEVVEGDAMQKLGEVTNHLQQWRRAGHVDGIVISAQSVLHELPYRSIPDYSPSKFFGQLLKGWSNILVCCREPCRPYGWPPVVQLKLKGVNGDTLCAVSRHIKDRLKFSGDVTALADDLVLMPADLALETLIKVLYLDTNSPTRWAKNSPDSIPKRSCKCCRIFSAATPWRSSTR